MKIAVIVCTLNEELNIRDRLKNFLDLQLPTGLSVTFHVIDNGSIDGTQAIVREFYIAYSEQIILHIVGPVGKCAALFWGFDNLCADYFILSDANTVFKQDVIFHFYNAIENNPNAGLFVGNIRSVSSSNDGLVFFQSKSKMQQRVLIEEALGAFSGANGGCYCVSKAAIEGITKFHPVRNDDFVISIYAGTRSCVRWVPSAQAYEIDRLSIRDVFWQKYRDALGHYQAIQWITRYVRPSTKAWTSVLMRLTYWLSPLVLMMLAYSLLSLDIFFALLSITFIPDQSRNIWIRLFALYLGFIKGVLAPPTVSWATRR